MGKLLKYFKGYTPQVILGPLFKCLEACLELMLPIIMATLVNNAYGVETKIGGFVIPLNNVQCIVWMSASVVTGFSFTVIAQYFAAASSAGFGGRLREALFEKLLYLSDKELDSIGNATLINRITNDVNQLQLAVAMVIRLVLRAPVLAAGAFFMAFLINKTVAFIFGISIPVVGAILYFIMRKTIPIHRTVQTNLDKITVVTRENLTGARVVRAFSRQDMEIERGVNATTEYYRSAVKVNKISALMNPLASLLMNFGIAIMIVIGASQVNKGAITSAEISAFVTYFLWILSALTIIANTSVIITKAIASADRINAVLDLEPSVKDTGTELPDRNNATALSFNNVSFRYNETGNRVLKNITFEMPTNSILAIIGGTGSGKSSLAALIPRFYDPSEGEIKLFGKDVASYSQEELRRSVAIALQTPNLFAGTLRENIALGDENPDDKRIIESLKLAEAWEFVKKLNNGLDAEVLAGGKNFSGGQIQRLSVARALYRRPALLILDDSASALDFATEARLRKNLKKLVKTTSIIIISQRAGSVRHADQIIVLDSGGLAGIGSHKELLESSPLYREICLSQFNEEEL